MAVYNTTRPVRTLMGKLAHDGDLLAELNAIARENDIRLGRVEAIGAVRRATIGFYSQETFTYEFMQLDAAMEITNLAGNISIKDGQPFVHAHINLADEQGRVFGGHLGEGTTVFACEFVMTELDGPEFVRDLDEQTRLPLWKM